MSGLDVVFYDRKHKREVKASQLMDIKLVQMTLSIDSEEYKNGPWLGQEKHPAYLNENIIGSIAYKSENCPNYCNWDLWLHDSDLIFLRTESKE